MNYFRVTVRYYFNVQPHYLIRQKAKREQVKGKLKASHFKYKQEGKKSETGST